jgi:signal transduction histidine kinase
MKLATRLFIFSSIFLVLLPWLGFHFIAKVEQSLLQGQEEAQSMVASAIATSLKGYTDYFDVDRDAHYVYPLKQIISVDGYDDEDEDWTRLKQQFTSYDDGRLSLLLVADEDFLYAYLKVIDSDIVYRNPRYLSLDSSDHIRFEYIDSNSRHRRLVLLAEGQGDVSVYESFKDWSKWKNSRHISALDGIWRETEYGYDVELKLPIRWLQPEHRVSFSVVDVFGENERHPDAIVSTRGSDDNTLNTLVFHSHEISGVIKNLAEFDSRICVIDKSHRIRAMTGGDRLRSSFCRSKDKVDEKWAGSIVSGKGQVTGSGEDDETLIVASSPVFDGDEVIAAVLVGKNSRQILSRHRDTLIDVILATLVLFFLVIISLFIFSSWLTFRINRLKNQTSSLIDESGRFIKHIDLSDVDNKDEIGDLSRSFSSLLDRLNSYTCFLESVPRMLRHEILNPVNTISMSLQSLQDQEDSSERAHGIDAACHAIRQLQLIVSSLTEAASIDEALVHDEMETIDIAALLTEYVHNSQLKHENSILRYAGEQAGVYVRGNDLRIVQLIDKLKDNAIDFASPGSEISFQLDMNHVGKVIIRVKNRGETIPMQRLDTIFQGMVSHRSVKTEVPHLGIGLYVAHQIAEFHHGQLQINNLKNEQGVEVVLVLPRTKTDVDNKHYRI